MIPEVIISCATRFLYAASFNVIILSVLHASEGNLTNASLKGL